MIRMRSTSAGFTLVELMIVAGIIGVLSTMVILNVDKARARSRDAQKKTNLATINLALNSFYVMNGRMPLNYNGGNPACDGSSAWNSSMQELVDAGLLQSIPRTPSAYGLYCYFDYGSGDIGALVWTYLETGTPNTGASPTSPVCLPWPSEPQWCNKGTLSTPNWYYCVCAPY